MKHLHARSCNQSQRLNWYSRSSFIHSLQVSSLGQSFGCFGLLAEHGDPIIHLWRFDVITLSNVQFNRSVMSDCVTPWTTARQASLSITNSWSPPKPMFIESVMPSNQLILCCPLLLLLSIFPSIRVFSDKSALSIRWPKYWSFSFNISPSNEHPGLISFRIDWFDLLTHWYIECVFKAK